MQRIQEVLPNYQTNDQRRTSSGEHVELLIFQGGGHQTRWCAADNVSTRCVTGHVSIDRSMFQCLIQPGVLQDMCP